MTPATMEILDSAYPGLAFFLGLLIGSFYNVCVHRYLSGESIVFPGSKCPYCNHSLSWWENIPLASFIFLRAKCRSCAEPISWRYPTVELVSGLWALGLAWKFPLNLTAGPLELGWEWSLAIFAVHMVVGGILIVASFIDFDSYILPDILTLPGAVLALAGAYFVLRPSLGWPTLTDSLIGAGIGAGLFWLLQFLYRKLKGMEGLGTGDIKLMLLLGAWNGWQALPFTLLAAGVTAIAGYIVYNRMNDSDEPTMVPFGPFLSLGGMLYVLFGDWYWAYLGGGI